MGAIRVIHNKEDRTNEWINHNTLAQLKIILLRDAVHRKGRSDTCYSRSGYEILNVLMLKSQMPEYIYQFEPL